MSVKRDFLRVVSAFLSDLQTTDGFDSALSSFYLRSFHSLCGRANHLSWIDEVTGGGTPYVTTEMIENSRRFPEEAMKLSFTYGLLVAESDESDTTRLIHEYVKKLEELI